MWSYVWIFKVGFNASIQTPAMFDPTHAKRNISFDIVNDNLILCDNRTTATLWTTQNTKKNKREKHSLLTDLLTIKDFFKYETKLSKTSTILLMLLSLNWKL